MAWKYKRWKIKWNPKKRKFKKIKRDRKLSRDAHIRALMNKGKMKMALRKSRLKGRITMKKNKAMGIYKKLAVARKRYKNILKSDMNMETFFDQMINEEKYTPEMELDTSDLEQIIYSLKQIQRNVEFDDKEETKDFEDYVDSIVKYISSYDSSSEFSDDDREFFGEILSIIEEFGEEAGLLADDDDNDDRKDV